MSWFSVDVETDGPAPGLYSMIEIGAVMIREPIEAAPIFSATLRPISDNFVEEALAVSNRTRKETLEFEDPIRVMHRFDDWVRKHNTDKQPRFIADNNGFDFAFVNYYFHKFLNKNPFGFSSQNINSLYKGLTNDTFASFKHLRQPYKHSHKAWEDALGNANAIVRMKNEMGLNIKLDKLGAK